MKNMLCIFLNSCWNKPIGLKSFWVLLLKVLLWENNLTNKISDMKSFLARAKVESILVVIYGFAFQSKKLSGVALFWLKNYIYSHSKGKCGLAFNLGIEAQYSWISAVII